MAVKNPKQKGNAYERKIAKSINQQVFGFDALYRQTNSGGLKRETLYTGDIVPLNNSGLDAFPFHLELKKGYQWDVLDMIRERSPKNKINQFWNQAVRDRVNPARQPYIVLILGKDRKGDFVVFENKLLTAVSTTQIKARYYLVEMPQIRFTYFAPHPTILVMANFQDFLHMMSDVQTLATPTKKPRLRVVNSEK